MSFQLALPTSDERRTATMWRLLYGLAGLIALLAHLVVLQGLFKYNIVHSDECLWVMGVRNGDTVLLVKEIAEGGAADKAGVKVGDVVVAIDGRLAAGHMNDAQKLLNEAPLDRDISYVVERDGQILELTMRLVQQPQFIQFVSPTFSVLWLAIALVVGLANPLGRVQRRFFFTGVLVVFAFTFPAALGGAAGMTTLLRIVWSLLGVLFFIQWVRFCSSFPVQQNAFTTVGRKLLLYSALILNLLLVAAGIVLDLMGRYLTMTESQVIGIVSGALSAIYFGAGVWFLFRGYLRMPPTADRRPMRVILIGTILAAMALLYFMVLRSGIAGAVIVLHPQLLLPIVLLLALPFSFGYAIFKYQVMDFRRVLSTTLVYTTTMALIAGLYIGLAYGIGQAFSSLASGDIAGPVGVGVFVVFVMFFEPLKRRIQTAVENRFFPQRRDYSAHLSQFAAEVSETVGTRSVAQATARMLRTTLDLDGVIVVMENRRIDDLDVVARDCSFGMIYVEEDAVRRLWRLVQRNHALLSLETQGDPALESLQRHFSYAIGLYAQGRTIGAILMTRPKDGSALSGSQTPFIAGVASNAAAALEVGRLYEEELERQRYQEELSTARKIQESLLPREMPDLPGIQISALSRPAQAVGGDYYDVIRLEDGRILVVIADVSGKGLAASLYMAEFHGMVHVVAGLGGTPKEMLVRLNDHLFDVITRGSFISATILLFDTARRSVTYARAGHTPILRHNGPIVDALVPNGVALGLCSRALFAELLQEYTVEYASGETFILYSDGVSEAMNEQREEFGDGRLHDIIKSTADPSVDVLRDQILWQLERFRGTAEQNDDITLVVVKIERESYERPTLPQGEKRAPVGRRG